MYLSSKGSNFITNLFSSRDSQELTSIFRQVSDLPQINFTITGSNSNVNVLHGTFSIPSESSRLSMNEILEGAASEANSNIPSLSNRLRINEDNVQDIALATSLFLTLATVVKKSVKRVKGLGKFIFSKKNK